MRKYTKLFQPPLLDFSILDKNDNVKIVIYNMEHKFAPDAKHSGNDITKQPIFGCNVYVNNTFFLKTSYGLPFIRFPQGCTPKITYVNKTLFTFNIHYHGLNTDGSIDGTAMELVFGHNTLLGPTVTYRFPKITNNQALLWYHSHNMFVSMELIYGGLFGLLQIVDKPTKWLTDNFQYGDNQILLNALDMDLTIDGTQTFANLVTDENRSNYTVINGTSAINWYSSSNSVPFVTRLLHTTTKNLVKIDILNASLNWRVFHIGVCDNKKEIKPFYLVQTDSGLMNPVELKMAYIPVASRVGIIIDLNQFHDKIAYLFFYNYDLTEIFESYPTFSDQPNNSTITAIIPDLMKSNNPTPYPTPIPDPGNQNQQNTYTNLNYPSVNLIPQTKEILENGTIKIPHTKDIKIFLKIELKGKCRNNICLKKIIGKIKETVFGYNNCNLYESILNQPCFEYNSMFNYLPYLNRNYFYNLPDFNINVPTRNIIMFPESNINAFIGGNINGTSEYVDGANRIMVDLWNSAELNLEWALQQYENSPNNYKPPTLPTSKFRIYKTNDEYSNTAMISNDTLEIQIFEKEIAYGDFTQEPLTTVTVVFPPTASDHLLNLQEWIDLVNQTFKQTFVDIPNSSKITLDKIIVCDWSFFPYTLNFLYDKNVYIKSAVIKTINNSDCWIRLLARWPLLQFFGMPMTGNTLDLSDLMTRLRTKQQKIRENIRRHDKSNGNENINFQLSSIFSSNRLSPDKNSSLYIKCDEVGTYGTYDAEIQQIFPFYATFNGDVQLPIACMKRDAELIIAPHRIYIGLYDGYLNDDLNSFSVRLRSSENWIYINGDNADAHSLHFHLTSGYASPNSHYNSPGLLSRTRLQDQLIYSRDIYRVGPQETVSFHLTWPEYSSYDETSMPKINGIGGVIHCHFLQHNDANSMIIQYFVDNK